MAKVCTLTGKRVIRGNNVSHAHNKTRRSFEPNLQYVRLYSNALKRYIRLRIATSTIRTLDKKGGLDKFLLTRRAILLGETARKLKKKIVKANAKQADGNLAEGILPDGKIISPIPNIIQTPTRTAEISSSNPNAAPTRTVAPVETTAEQG